MYLMVAAVAKDSTTAIIMSSPFMNLVSEKIERNDHRLFGVFFWSMNWTCSYPFSGSWNQKTLPLLLWKTDTSSVSSLGSLASQINFYWISVSSRNMQCQRPTSTQSHLGTFAGFGGNPKHSKATWYQQASNRVHLHYIPIYFIIFLIIVHDYFIIFHYESWSF